MAGKYHRRPGRHDPGLRHARRQPRRLGVCKLPSDGPFANNIRHGFVLERARWNTSGSIANNAEIDVIWERWQNTLKPLREKLNKVLKETWEEWQVPGEVDDKWPAEAKVIHAQWWEARRTRQKEIDESIAHNADVEYLYNRPYKARGIVRVAGPFTVESLSPHRVLPMGEDLYLEELLAAVDVDSQVKPSYDNGGVVQTDFAQVVYENLKAAGVQNTKKGETPLSIASAASYPRDCLRGTRN
jgi:adenine-specific DNA-methyltransferase